MSRNQQPPTLHYAPPEFDDAADPGFGFFGSLAISLASLALVGSLVAILGLVSYLFALTFH